MSTNSDVSGYATVEVVSVDLISDNSKQPRPSIEIANNTKQGSLFERAYSSGSEQGGGVGLPPQQPEAQLTFTDQPAPHAPPGLDAMTHSPSPGATLPQDDAVVVSRKGGDGRSHGVNGSVVRARRSANGRGEQYGQNTSDGAALGNAPSLSCAANDAGLSDKEKIAKLEAQNHFFKRHYLETAVLPSGFLDRETRAISKAVDRVEVSSILYTSTPFAAALSKVWFRRILFFVALTLLVLGSLSINSATIAGQVVGPCRMFRFSPLQLRDGTLAAGMQPREQTGSEGGAWPGEETRGDATWFLHDFGPMMNGCLLRGANATSGEGRSVQVEFLEPVEFDGWYWITAYDSPAGWDPVVFVLEVSEDGREWTRKGASGWTYDYLEGLALHEAVFPTQEKRGHVHRFPRAMPWPAVLTKIVHPIYCGLVILATTYTGAIGMEHAGKTVFTLGFFVDGLIFLSAALGVARGGQQHSPMFGLVLYMGLFTILIAVLLAYCEKYFVYIILAMGVSFSVSGMYAYFGVDRDVTALVASGVDGILLVIFCLFVIWHRSLLLDRARKMIAGDVARYQAEWEALLAEEGSVTALEMLKARLDQLSVDETGQGGSVDHKIRQVTQASSDARDALSRSRGSSKRDAFDRVRHASSLHFGASHRGRPKKELSHTQRFVFAARIGSDLEAAGGTLFQAEALEELVDPGPIRSLDQLYAQAYAVYPSMVTKAKSWAAASNGLFFAENGPGEVTERTTERTETTDAGSLEVGEAGEVCLIPWRRAQANPASESLVKFAKVKSKDRAIEKLLRSYAGDPSRLVDLCRQTIVFSNVADLCACVEALAEDPEIQIVRVKNRYDIDYPAAQKSAGYRDCLLNLRIATDATCELGASHHICELQLILSRFALLKRKDGHKRYVTFRNVRGE